MAAADAGMFPSLETRVPRRWVKFYAALVLLPVVWVLTKTFFGALAWDAIEHGVWNHPPFRLFVLGAGAFLIVFMVVPLPVRLYVFGHEITHALWVLLSGGRIGGMRIDEDGGYVLSDRVNTWIALAPYFFPFYSAVLLFAFGIAGLWTDPAPLVDTLCFGLGFTWGYHIAYTCWMIPKGQSDLEYGGFFFSLIVIYIANLLLLAVFLVAASPRLSTGLFLHELLHNAIDFSHWLVGVLREAWRMMESWIS